MVSRSSSEGGSRGLCRERTNAEGLSVWVQVPSTCGFWPKSHEKFGVLKPESSKIGYWGPLAKVDWRIGRLILHTKLLAVWSASVLQLTSRSYILSPVCIHIHIQKDIHIHTDTDADTDA